MQNYFFKLADELTALLRKDEVFTLGYAGESSDFIRFNHNKVRQAGQVTQNRARLELIRGKRHVAGELTLAGHLRTDREPVKTLLEEMRLTLDQVPDDPHLHYAREVKSSENIGDNQLPTPDHALDTILEAAEGRDLVGIYAAGGIYRGFANSLGQRNWFASYNFNFDWSFFLEGDKAVKCSYAGFDWEPRVYRRKVDEATQHLEVLALPARKIDPGHYRVYLAPAAFNEVMTMLSWGGFSLKSKCTKQTPLLKMVNKEVAFSPSITLAENTREGVAPAFESNGFIKPEKVVLINKGNLEGFLISPRSAKEYGVKTNGAEASEEPRSLDLAPGTLAEEAILTELGTGVYVSNLWYLNYSDRRNCRMTGLTRFATFWVEQGRLVAPLKVMRFDESAYRILGSELIGLTREREFLLDPDTYEQRGTASVRLPGALVGRFEFTL